MVSELSILLVGSAFRSEFRHARAAFHKLGRIVPATDVDAAVAALSDGHVVPDLIVIAQAHPGQFSPEAIDRLRALAPLARVLGLLGSWCEGEMRTGRPWPAAVRVYWHQWVPRCQQELGRLQDGVCSTWGLPATVSEEERLLALAERPLPRREGLIAISAARFDMHQWLSAACRRRGYSTIWLQTHRMARVDRATAAIFDATECLGEELRQLELLRRSVGPAPIIALLDFPRVGNCQRALAAGASAVLSKPLLLEDLFWQMDRLLDQS